MHQNDTDIYTKQAFSRVSANETEPGTNIHEYYPETPLESRKGIYLGIFNLVNVTAKSYFMPREKVVQLIYVLWVYGEHCSYYCYYI